MVEFSTTSNRVRLAAASSLIATAVIAIGLVSAFQPQTAVAANCDTANIVYCGLEGNSLNANIKSFQGLYNKGSDKGNDDLQTVYKWAGASKNDVANMSSANTKLGTMYRDGKIKVDGKVIATDAWVSARFGAGRDGFKHVTSNVYARKTTTSLAESSAPVLVHFNKKNQMDFAVMTGCGNAVKATPKPAPQPKPEPKPQPKPEPKPQASLECVDLTAQALSDIPRNFNFSAKAAAKNTSIVSYTFDFGDGSTKTVVTDKTLAAVTHQFAKDGQSYTVTVTVTDGKQSDNCKVTVKTPTPPEECKPGIPVGDARCNPTTSVTPTTPTPPLPNTGMNAGLMVGLFGAIVTAAGFGHRFLTGRKLGY